jgi:AcrR family transcriptional regulator
MTGEDDGGTALSRGEARRRALLDAAWELFRERGIEATTVDEIIARAGGSRATIYSAFGDKDGLIETAVGENCAAFAQRMMAVLDGSEDPAATLTALARDLVSQIWTAEAKRIFGDFLTEGHRFPQVVDAFLGNGPCRLQARLARYLAGVRDRGQADIDDPELAARLFLDALHGDWLIGSLGGGSARDPDDPQTRRWIRYIVARTLNQPVDSLPLTARE